MPPSTPIRRLYEHLASAKCHRALRCDNSSRLERKCRHQLQSVSIWRRDSIGVEQSGFDDSLADIARENEWENGHHESAEISCVAVEDTLTSLEEKSQGGEDYFIRELSPCKSSLSDDNVDYDTSPTVQCNQQSSFVRSFSRFKLKLSSWFIPFRLRVIWDSCGN